MAVPRLTPILLAGLALYGCQSEMPASPALAQKLGETCRASYGYQPGTRAYADCVFYLDQARIASNKRTRRAFGNALVAAGNSIDSARPAPPQIAAPIIVQPAYNGCVPLAMNC